MKKQKLNEFGRSMVEMLGVLAVIGVLSMTGISGYKMTIGKHKANQFLSYLEQFVLDAQIAASTRGSVSMTWDDFTYQAYEVGCMPLTTSNIKNPLDDIYLSLCMRFTTTLEQPDKSAPPTGGIMHPDWKNITIYVSGYQNNLPKWFQYVDFSGSIVSSAFFAGPTDVRWNCKNGYTGASRFSDVIGTFIYHFELNIDGTPSSCN